MKKLILMIVMITSSLSAYYVEDLTNTQIRSAALCMLTKFNDSEIRLHKDNLIKFMENKNKIEQSKELKELFWKADENKKVNFKGFKVIYQKIEEEYKRQRLAQKYNLNPKFEQIIFNPEYLTVKNIKEFNKLRRKMELIEIIIKPLLEKGNENAINCMPESL